MNNDESKPSLFITTWNIPRISGALETVYISLYAWLIQRASFYMALYQSPRRISDKIITNDLYIVDWFGPSCQVSNELFIKLEHIVPEMSEIRINTTTLTLYL